MWVFATRSRPENCARFIQSWVTTKATTPVYVRVDSCDPMLDEITTLPWPDQFEIVVGKRVGLSRSINETFECYPNEPWYGILADDLVPRTLQWDLELTKVCGSWNISYPNDGGDRDWPTHPCMGGDLIRAIGWFGFPPCHHYFTDTVWRYLGQELSNITRLDHIIVEHMHYSVGKSLQDTVYKQSNQHYKTDKLAYRNWIRSDGPALVERLQCLI